MWPDETRRFRQGRDVAVGVAEVIVGDDTNAPRARCSLSAGGLNIRITIIVLSGSSSSTELMEASR